MADDCYGAPVKLCEPGDQGLVVAIAAVAMQFNKVREEHRDIVQRIRALLVTRNLSTLPGPQMAVKLPAQLSNLPADALELRVGLFVPCELAQLFDIFFQALDFALSIHLRRCALCFVLGFHHITKSIDWSPIHARMAAMSSGQARTRRSTWRVADAPLVSQRSSEPRLDPR